MSEYHPEIPLYSGMPNYLAGDVVVCEMTTGLSTHLDVVYDSPGGFGELQGDLQAGHLASVNWINAYPEGRRIATFITGIFIAEAIRQGAFIFETDARQLATARIFRRFFGDTIGPLDGQYTPRTIRVNAFNKSVAVHLFGLSGLPPNYDAQEADYDSLL